jgi:hypothetical protein
MARHNAQPKPAQRSGTRCAIYTRKSSEDGLEQKFNSLHAQREACLAYITSQRHEGWTALPTHYDDGGFSGGTLNRLALQRLLADIRAGKLDLVVIYKVDRLTRSLSDFAKLVETFDAHDVSFVSITQHFNTTTSMGRLRSTSASLVFQPQMIGSKAGRTRRHFSEPPETHHKTGETAMDWLGDLDSNQGCPGQSREFYR